MKVRGFYVVRNGIPVSEDPCPVRRATGMLVAAIYLVGGNTENMKGCQVSVFCCDESVRTMVKTNILLDPVQIQCTLTSCEKACTKRALDTLDCFNTNGYSPNLSGS